MTRGRAADLSVVLLELRSYVEGVQATCCAGDNPMQLKPHSLMMLFEPVLRHLEELERYCEQGSTPPIRPS